MLTMRELLKAMDQLPAADKWHLVRHLLHTLEYEQTGPVASSDWHEFLRATYGILRDTPIRRWEQGEYEEREPLE
ncbi:MAG: hypothetical protein H6672_05720 [Anaerolineaceae bacterium]|nr:hypothetical protein [Anaerolineaceae bacterium]